MEFYRTHTREGEPIPQSVASRIRRGIELYAECGHGDTYRLDAIVHLGAGKYRVPSATGFGSYIVDIEEETCQCADREGRKMGADKHIVAALIEEAKTPEYRVERGRYHDALGGPEFLVYEYRLGERVRLEGAYGSQGAAYAAKWGLEGARGLGVA